LTVEIQQSIKINDSCAFRVSKSHEVLNTNPYEVLLYEFSISASDLVIVSILKSSQSRAPKCQSPEFHITLGDIHTLHLKSPEFIEFF
jgi:hypothetical protein